MASQEKLSTAVFITSALLFLQFNLSFSLSLFGVDKEYRYNYETLVTVGQESPSSFASAYKIKGILKVNGISSTKLNVRMDNLTIGIYNGPWTYFPIPNFDFLELPEILVLGEPFQLETENGKFKSLILNDLEPEWASNMKRGLASFLQMDFSTITSFDKMQVLNIREMTTVGECKTKMEVLPSSTTLNGRTRINKFRNHADCPDIPTRSKLATQNYYQCSDESSRDIMNSTSYSTYELDFEDGGRQPVLKGITLFSSVLFWPFTSAKAYQFSWLNMTITFDSSLKLDGTQTFPPPENAETHEDLMYVFEQPDPTDVEDENPDLNSETLFFHHTGPDLETETMQKIVELCYSRISQVAESLSSTDTFLTNTERFHSDSVLNFLPLISSLDYEHLTNCYKHYESGISQNELKLMEFYLFLDGLILSGTSQSTLVLKDILISPSTSSETIARIVTTFPYYIRNPVEAIAKEMHIIFETLSNNSKLSTSLRRTTEFSMASVIGRCCRKTLCVNSGLLDKYINYFETKLIASSSFEERTAAILGLRNLEAGKALDRVLDIATGSLVYEQTVRVQAIWALSSLIQTDSKRLFDTLLPVFYNRTERCEIRTTVFTFLMSLNPDKRILHDIAYFMWTEYCPQTFNIVRSFLINAVNSKAPCNKIGSYARTILNYLPPASVDPLRTTIYSTEYFDDSYGFGRQFYSLVQKSGTATLPISVYFGANNFIGGFAGSSFGVFIRMEGIEKTIAAKFASMRSANIEQVQKLLSQIDLTHRTNDPLILEFMLIWQNHVIVYYAADEKSLSSSLPVFLKELTDQLSKNVQFNLQQSLLHGGIFHQLPLEIGTPMSVSIGVQTSIGLMANITKTQSAQKSSHRLQFSLFGRTTIANHVPAIGTMHGVSTQRTVRFVFPRNMNFQFGNEGFQITHQIPSENNPILLMAHGTSFVSVVHDSASNSKHNDVLGILEKSCPNCKAQTIISRGDQFRKSRHFFNSENLSPISGIRIQAKFFDCERDHSHSALLQQFSEFFSDKGKNFGSYNLLFTKYLLTTQHANDYLFWSPSAETCGVLFSFSQESAGKLRLESVESIVATEFQLSDNNGSSGDKIMNGSITSTTTYNYGDQPQQQQQSKSTLKSTLDFKSIAVGINGTNEFSTNLNFNFNGKGETKVGSLCFNMKTLMNQLPKDILAYTNENEPSVEEEIQFSYGLIPESNSNKNSQDCLANIIKLKIHGRASRSIEQITEAESVMTSPYRECADQIKNSAGAYGDFIPPTLQCFGSALEQTSLRNLNSTIYYKVSKSLPKSWKDFGVTAAGLLYSFSSVNPFTQTSPEHQHVNFQPESSDSQNFYEGFVEMDLNIRKESSPSLDIHHSIVGSNRMTDEMHAHGITLLNQYIKPSPIPARFSPYLTTGFQSGFLSQCTMTSTWINTLDSFNYNLNISSECSSLMSADCSANPQYAVAVNKLRSGKIGLNVQMGSEYIKLTESNQGKNLQVTLNKKVVKLQNHEKFNGNGVFILLRNEDEIYIVSRLSGFHIRYTGYFATITLDSRYRGIHCGLCGHWDSSFPNDLMGPNTSCPLLSPENMFEAYSLGVGVSDDASCNKKGTKCLI